jgi:hypothetical protein
MEWIFGLFGDKGFGEAVRNGITAVGDMIGKLLGKPFKESYDWICSFLGGKSPSKLGLSIVKGIESIGSMVFDFLTSPFRTAFDFVSKLFGFDGIGSTIVNSIKSLGDAIYNALIFPFKKGIDFISNLPVVGGLISKGVELVTGSTEDKSINTANNQATTSPNDAVLKKFDEFIRLQSELISLMKSGGIAVNMDGRKVSDALVAANSNR